MVNIFHEISSLSIGKFVGFSILSFLTVACDGQPAQERVTHGGTDKILNANEGFSTELQYSKEQAHAISATPNEGSDLSGLNLTSGCQVTTAYLKFMKKTSSGYQWTTSSSGAIGGVGHGEGVGDYSACNKLCTDWYYSIRSSYSSLSWEKKLYQRSGRYVCSIRGKS